MVAHVLGLTILNQGRSLYVPLLECLYYFDYYHLKYPSCSQDFGYPQGTSTEILKSYICNTSCPVSYDSRTTVQRSQGTSTLPSHAANKPIATSLETLRNQKNEVFIDLLERLTVLVAANVSTVMIGTVHELCFLIT